MDILFFRQLFDTTTATYSYFLMDPKTKEAALVDSVVEQHNRDLKLIKELNANLKYCFETHIHADHITGGGKMSQVTGCQKIVPIHSNAKNCDYETKDGDQWLLGSQAINVLYTPGHTDSHVCLLIDNNTKVLTGDTLFIRGCGRTDFQSGDPGILYDSIQTKLFSLPEDTLVYPGHDYNGNTCSSIFEEKHFNPRLANKSREDFIEIMNNLHLPYPKKMDKAVPANLACGQDK